MLTQAKRSEEASYGAPNDRDRGRTGGARTCRQQWCAPRRSATRFLAPTSSMCPKGGPAIEVSRTSLRRFPYLAVLGGVAGVGLLVLLVISVLIVSDDSRRPAVEMQQAPSTSAAPTRAVTLAPTSAGVPAMPAPEPAQPGPSEVPTPQDQPPVQVMAPQAPRSAETMRPEPPPPPPLQMFSALTPVVSKHVPRGSIERWESGLSPWVCRASCLALLRFSFATYNVPPRYSSAGRY